MFTSSRFFFLLFIVGTLAASPGGASAEEGLEGATTLAAPPRPDEPPLPSVVSVELLAGTTAPLDIWAGIRLVLFERLLVSASVGHTVYGAVVGSVAVALGGAETAALVEPVFSNGWVFRLGVGVRPFGRTGPELSVGYAQLSASAEWGASTLGLPTNVGTVAADVGLDLIYVELGWSIHLAGPLFLRPAIGWTQALGADVALRTTSGQSGPAAAAVAEASAAAERTVVSYGRTPTLSLSVGAHF